MARSAAEQKRVEREREALGLVECRPCWPRARAFEEFANAGLINDQDADDREARGKFVALIFEAVADRLSRGDTMGAALGIHSGSEFRRDRR